MVAVLALILFGRMAAIHRETWDWRLTPAAAPTAVYVRVGSVITGYGLMGGP